MRPDRLKQLRSAGFDDVANEYLQLVGELEIAGRLNLVSVAEYIATRSNVFQNTESWRWFERANRLELLEAGAVSMPAGKKLINPRCADSVVLAVGKRMAATRSSI